MLSVAGKVDFIDARALHVVLAKDPIERHAPGHQQVQESRSNQNAVDGLQRWKILLIVVISEHHVVGLVVV